MSEWALKRFWTAVTVEEIDDGFEVLLDGSKVKTPAKRDLRVPSSEMATEVAAEWEAQLDVVDPTSMPWTRSANAALDKVATQRAEVMQHLAGYAGTDLLSYRAAQPQGLVERQNARWDPILSWLETRCQVRLAVTSGVMPVMQDQAVLDRLAAEMTPMSDFQLTAFHDLVTLTGSFVLGLAAKEAAQAPEALWDLSRLDEDWQIEQWGEDDEASELAEIKRSAFLHAVNFYQAA